MAIADPPAPITAPQPTRKEASDKPRSCCHLLREGTYATGLCGHRTAWGINSSIGPAMRHGRCRYCGHPRCPQCAALYSEGVR